MKISVYSDIHLEHEERYSDLALLDDADVRILAGDICDGEAHHIDWILNQPKVPTIYIAGNHEFYGHNWCDQIERLRSAFAGTHVHFLERDVFEIAGWRFLGCTLWTDFMLDGDPAWAMYAAAGGVADFHEIKCGPKPFSPYNAARIHQSSIEWLERQMQKADPAKTVVVTHHAPSILSVDPFYRKNSLTPCFASNLDESITAWRPAAWVHGHIHDSADYQIGGTRVVCNPRGYPGTELNPDFQACCVVEI